MSKLTAELGINTSSFEAGLKKAANSVPDKLKRGSKGAGESAGSTIAGELNSALERKIGMNDVFRSFFGVIGLDAQRIAESIAESLFGGSLEAYRELSRAQDEVGALIDKNRLAMKDYAAQAAYARKEIAAAEGEMNTPKKQGDIRILDQDGNEIGRAGGENDAEAGLRQANAAKRRENAVAALRAAEAAQRANENRQSNLLSSFNRAGADESASSQIARLREESDALINLSRNVKLTADERRKYWEEGVARATQARQAQRELAKAERDHEKQIADMRRQSGRENMTERGRISDMRAESAELNKLAKSAKTEAEARDMKSRAQKLSLDAQKAETDLSEKAIETERRIAELKAKRASLTETEEQSIRRLIAEADALNRSASDETRNQADRDKDRIAAQERINSAIEKEISLRRSTLSIADIAESGGSTKRGIMARRSIELTRKASAAEAIGDFATSERYRSQGRSIEQDILSQRRLAIEKQDAMRAAALDITTRYASSPSSRAQAAERAGIPARDLDRLSQEQREKNAQSKQPNGSDRVVSVLEKINDRLAPSSTK